MDHRAQAKKRILQQYRNGENYKRWIDTLPKIAQESIEGPAELLLNILDIDRQSGAQLDLLGRIVGVRRQAIVINDAAAVFDLGGGQLGDDGAQLSAPSYSSTSPFGDEVFRLLIRARISRNNSNATIDGIIDAVSFVVNQGGIRVNDNQNMTFSLMFAKELTPIERFTIRAFDIIPRPQGVEFLGYNEAPLIAQLGGEFSQLGDATAQLGPSEF